MAVLNGTNSSVDKSSGAVIFHKSPELLEIIRLRNDIKEINQKMDTILEILGGGERDGTKMGE